MTATKGVVGIACADADGENTFPSSTCTVGGGTEADSIVFIAPYTGDYRVCKSFNHRVNIGANETVNAAFRLAVTNNNDDTVISNGNAIVSSLNDADSQGDTALEGKPMVLCDTFTIQKGKTTIRSLYTQDIVGVVSSFFPATTNHSGGQPYIYWDVQAITQQFPQAIALEGYEKITLDISSSGDFSAAQPLLTLIKFRDRVTLQWDNLAHSSDAAPTTAVGFIPAQYLPSYDVQNTYSFNFNVVAKAIINTDGRLELTYIDYAGGLLAQTSSISGGSLTWNID